MSLEELLTAVKTLPDTVEFEDTMAVIENLYTFTPTAFTNGGMVNEAEQNSGSCKLFAFAQLQGLSQQETLQCFGKYYRDDVLKHPDADDHQNIRNFMKTGWDGIQFESAPLRIK